MEISKIIIKMTDAEIENNPFFGKNMEPAFYNFLQDQLTNGTDNVTDIDCTKINVAENIMEKWFEILPIRSKNPIPKTDLSASILIYGPKADQTLENNCVSIEQTAFKTIYPSNINIFDANNKTEKKYELYTNGYIYFPTNKDNLNDAIDEFQRVCNANGINADNMCEEELRDIDSF